MGAYWCCSPGCGTQAGSRTGHWLGGGGGVDSLQIRELVQTLVCPSPTNGTGSSLWGGWSDEIPTPLALLLFSGCG